MTRRAPLMVLGAATLLAGTRAPVSLIDAVRAGRSSDEWARAAVVEFGAGVDTLAKVLELWRSREIVPSDLFDALADELKGQSGRLAGVWHTSFVQAIYESLWRAIQEGQSLREWLPHVQQLLDGFGAAGGERLYSGRTWSPWYADLVYRNAYAAAFAGGKYAEMFSERWMELAPFWLYSGILDDRIRETHRALDGKVFRKDDAAARRFLPPSSHNCRCVAIELDPDDVKAGEYEISRGASIDWEPEPGWDVDRVAALVPDALRRAA